VIAQSSLLVDRVAEVAADKKAQDIRVLEVGELVGYTDYFLICSGRTERQTKAIHDGVHEALKAEGVLPARVEGDREARWILMDYIDCVVHIFIPEARAYYRLEQLWGEAPARSVG